MLNLIDVMNVISKKIQVAQSPETANFEEKTLWYYPASKTYILYVKNEVVWTGFGASPAAKEYNKY